VHPMHLGLMTSHHAVRTPSAVAVEEGGRTLTYAELDARANRLAALLDGRGVGRGDRVALLVHNRIDVIEVLVATWKLGAIAASLNFRLSSADLQAIIDNAEPAVVVSEVEFAPMLDPFVAAGLIAPPVWLDDPADPYEAQLAAHPAAPPPHLLDVAWSDDAAIIYTSGTTGRPKGATFTHAAMLHHAANVLTEYDVDAATRYLVSIPHNSSVNISFVPVLYAGGTIVFTEVRSFDGADFLDTMNRLATTHTQLVPTMLYRVLEAHRASPVPLPAVRTIGYGSAPIPPERVAEMIETFGPVFVQLYGMTETAAMGTMLRKHEHVDALAGDQAVLASAGQASYGIHVRLVDDDGNDVADGERGEVIFKGSYVMRGYWRDPARTDEVLRDGWMHSGDVGVFRNGYLHIVDRKKDLIIRGGQNLASKEIEEAIYAHPAVLEVAVVGVPEPEWGEEVVAVVVLRSGAAATEEEIRTTCVDGGLARFKIPSRVAFVDDLPRNSIGKIQKGVLREQHARPAGA